MAGKHDGRVVIVTGGAPARRPARTSIPAG
jgi:hypothetical protein